MVDQAELADNVLAMGNYLQTVADVQKTTLEDVKAKFDLAIQNVLRLDANKSVEFILSRAKANLDNMFANESSVGDTYIFIPFGPIGFVSDTNKDIMEMVRTEFGEGKLQSLIDSGKVMTMNTPQGKVPVSEIKEYVYAERYIKDGVIYTENIEGGKLFKEVVDVVGTPWEKGHPIIYRDFRTKNRFEGSNFFYSKPLTQMWEFTLGGVAVGSESPNEWRLFELRVKYDQANPSSDNFLMKKMKPFKIYRGNFECYDASKPWIYKLNSPGQIKFLSTEMKSIEAIDVHVSKVLNGLRMAFGDAAAESGGFIPPFMFLPDIKAYHESTVLKDEQGNVITSGKDKYDKTRYNAYGIMSVYVKGINEDKDGSGGFRYVLHDSALKWNINAKPAAFIGVQDFKLPASCLCTIHTSRSAYRYDWTEKEKSNRKKYDPGNGDVSISIQAISPVVDLSIPEIKIDTGLMS